MSKRGKKNDNKTVLRNDLKRDLQLQMDCSGDDDVFEESISTNASNIDLQKIVSTEITKLFVELKSEINTALRTLISDLTTRFEHIENLYKCAEKKVDCVSKNVENFKTQIEQCYHY